MAVIALRFFECFPTVKRLLKAFDDRFTMEKRLLKAFFDRFTMGKWLLKKAPFLRHLTHHFLVAALYLPNGISPAQA